MYSVWNGLVSYVYSLSSQFGGTIIVSIFGMPNVVVLLVGLTGLKYCFHARERDSQG